ncbi:Panacea domain-containing protein [Pectobacterium odoriferum]|uniref:Panacea domain-containing protein n=1 Tax=Pectobacterium odoriferum TaxID=78398 RepID=UPI0009078D4E|nr:type II toxin-antitoxin system antitoxin SocA domain-containing protein [Pectobacterium odoriferum]
MYNPIQVANKFIELGIAAGKPITQMQAQKLTYIAHGVSLGHLNRPLLTDPICAWRYGPVIPSLYNVIKHNGSNPICSPINNSIVGEAHIDPLSESLIKNVFSVYGKYNAETLSNFTHRTGTPWTQAMNSGLTIIPDNIIENYYKGLIRRDANCIGL